MKKNDTPPIKNKEPPIKHLSFPSKTNPLQNLNPIAITQ
jgi:hypothetical protein